MVTPYKNVATLYRKLYRINLGLHKGVNRLQYNYEFTSKIGGTVQY